MNETYEARVDQIRARADAATPPPWIAHFTVHGDPSVVTDPNRPGFSTVAVVSKAPDDYGRADNEFIAHNAADVPWLLDRLAAATERVDEFRKRDGSQDRIRNRLTADLAAATERADKAEAELSDADERIEAAVEWGRTNAQEINVLGLMRALRVIAEVPRG